MQSSERSRRVRPAGLCARAGDALCTPMRPIPIVCKRLRSCCVQTHDADVLNAEAAKTAKAEGLEDAAYWFETVQGADTQHKNRFAKALKEVP